MRLSPALSKRAPAMTLVSALFPEGAPDGRNRQPATAGRQLVKLWLDDVRPAPDGWTWARTAREAIAAINAHAPEITEVSLDHDLGAPAEAGLYARGTAEENGKVVANHIAGYKQLDPGTPIRIHSWNPAGANFMAYVLAGSGYKVTVDPFRVEEFA